MSRLTRCVQKVNVPLTVQTTALNDHHTLSQHDYQGRVIEKPREFVGWRNKLHVLDDDMKQMMNAAADKKQAAHRAARTEREWEDMD